jgi:hypothetical protein
MILLVILIILTAKWHIRTKMRLVFPARNNFLKIIGRRGSGKNGSIINSDRKQAISEGFFPDFSL